MEYYGIIFNIIALSMKIECPTEIFVRKKHRYPSPGMNPKTGRHILVPESSFKYNTDHYMG